MAQGNKPEGWPVYIRMHEKKSDLHLIEKSLKGDGPAFEALVLRYQDRVFNICRYMLGERDADDAAQETFIKAYRNLGSFTPSPGFSAWISRIAVNTCIDYRRRPSHLSLTAATPEGEEYTRELSSGAPGPESSLESKRAGLAVAEAIGRLPEKLRAVVVLNEIEGFSYEEVAAQLEIPVGTVKSRLSRAREVLRRLLSFAREQI